MGVGIMLNHMKAEELTEMYESLEYQVLDELCDEWDMDQSGSFRGMSDGDGKRRFPDFKEACDMLDMRIFCAWMSEDCSLGKYDDFIVDESEKEDAERILDECRLELRGDLCCLRARRMAGEFLLIYNTGRYDYTPGLFEADLDLGMVRRQIDALYRDEMVAGNLSDLSRVVVLAGSRCYPELIQYVIQHEEEYERFVRENYC